MDLFLDILAAIFLFEVAMVSAAAILGNGFCFKEDLLAAHLMFFLVVVICGFALLGILAFERVAAIL